MTERDLCESPGCAELVTDVLDSKAVGGGTALCAGHAAWVESCFPLGSARGTLDDPGWLKWLSGCVGDERARKRAGLGSHSLPALTGQDTRALAAVAACWQLYASSDEDGGAAALDAIRHLLCAMQPKCRHVARALIAYAMDWSDIDPLWERVNDPACVTDPTALGKALHRLALADRG